ncbi:hypothetical protein POSPLADRAFT_1184158 [Postia placenta MAD-698-R-SB12]|uniref:Uncharacterized protein n=1 Tax=Postia placenta MAD-698-R-SB12 TaxID=670580 RepID=A0A1X6MSS0_9APHY|nr:hypothetical protein POSPLADRAFT_1184158 [Postia placenta MAD-698-R-SB12]OSX59418.1 hypothetical protein POSPLADRAFT_1184158 [Postia placenta MAD-698-R-SB12]
MLPLIPALALAFVSFLSSAFVILRIIVPILPPHPLSRRVRPSEFGLPNFRSLSSADKSHVWLASFDVVALILFAWQVISESLGSSPDYSAAHDPATAVRLWLVLTLRQTCLLVIAVLTLVHVRMGRSVALGKRHWMLWAPTFLLVATSTALAAVLSATAVPSFFMGLFAYSTTLAISSSVAFVCLMATFIMIRRNLATLNEIRDPWPRAQMEELPRPSFATEDIDALKDGSSWITSRASSRRESISAFSFSTRHSAKPSTGSVRIAATNPAMASQPSVAPKSSFWFNPATPYSGLGRESPVPPVPPLPSPYRTGSSPTSAQFHDDPDPFRSEPRDRPLGSQASWLTENSSYQPTLTAWSFPTSRPSSPPPSATTPGPQTELLPSTTAARSTPIMANAQVLGGYGYDTEKHTNGLALAPAADIDVSVKRTIGWLITIWIPQAMALPYFFTVTQQAPIASSPAAILLILSVTLSSPLLALHLLLRSPLPIPSGLFDTYNDPPSAVMRAPSPQSIPSLTFSHDYKRSGSVTVVEGRRSGDVWVSNGDAIGGKTKVGRALSLLQPVPRLAVLPVENIQEAQRTPPLPIQDVPKSPLPVPATPQSEKSEELGHHRTRKESKASSYYSGGSEALATQIMTAQKHYSSLAMTLMLPPSPDRRVSLDEGAVAAAATGVEPSQADTPRHSQHLRTRSVSSITGGSTPGSPRFPMSPPPASPLPPTPPSIRELRERQARMISHSKSQSQSSSLLNYSFRPVEGDDVGAIDSLSAGVLPLLVPGLTVGSDMKVHEFMWDTPASVSSKSSRGFRFSRLSKNVPQELGGISSEFSSPEMHSTPPVRKAVTTRQRKTSAHKRNHFSLPSLSLGKDGIHSFSTWRNDLNRVLDNAAGQHLTVATSETTRRNTVYGGEIITSTVTLLNAVKEEEESARPQSPPATAKERPASTHTFGEAPPSPEDVPTNVNTARNSLATLITALDQELRLPLPSSSASEVTLFDFDTSGPLAASTPHDAPKARSSSTQVPPLPQSSVAKSSRRSSIVYIRSDENAAPTGRVSPVVRPLIPKARAKADKPKGKIGLRSLSLLQDRNTNVGSPATETRGLSFSKKQKQKQVAADENAAPGTGAGARAKGLKPLRLIRKDTTKERAALRETEVLPDVVVRPPSQYNEFGYTFQ